MENNAVFFSLLLFLIICISLSSIDILFKSPGVEDIKFQLFPYISPEDIPTIHILDSVYKGLVTECGDGQVCGENLSCLIVDPGNPIFIGNETGSTIPLTVGKKYCLPVDIQDSQSCNVYTGYNIFTMNNGVYSNYCKCKYPELYSGSDCTIQRTCTDSQDPGQGKYNKLMNQRPINLDGIYCSDTKQPSCYDKNTLRWDPLNLVSKDVSSDPQYLYKSPYSSVCEIYDNENDCVGENEGSCIFTNDGCYQHTSSAECATHETCLWDSANNYCTGLDKPDIIKSCIPRHNEPLVPLWECQCANQSNTQICKHQTGKNCNKGQYIDQLCQSDDKNNCQLISHPDSSPQIKLPNDPYRCHLDPCMPDNKYSRWENFEEENTVDGNIALYNDSIDCEHTKEGDCIQNKCYWDYINKTCSAKGGMCNCQYQSDNQPLSQSNVLGTCYLADCGTDSDNNPLPGAEFDSQKNQCLCANKVDNENIGTRFNLCKSRLFDRSTSCELFKTAADCDRYSEYCTIVDSKCKNICYNYTQPGSCNENENCQWYGPNYCPDGFTTCFDSNSESTTSFNECSNYKYSAGGIQCIKISFDTEDKTYSVQNIPSLFESKDNILGSCDYKSCDNQGDLGYNSGTYCSNACYPNPCNDMAKCIVDPKTNIPLCSCEAKDDSKFKIGSRVKDGNENATIENIIYTTSDDGEVITPTYVVRHDNDNTIHNVPSVTSLYEGSYPIVRDGEFCESEGAGENVPVHLPLLCHGIDIPSKGDFKPTVDFDIDSNTLTGPSANMFPVKGACNKSLQVIYKGNYKDRSF